MPLIPIIGGALAGWFIRKWNVALAVTAVLFVAASALLLIVTATDPSDEHGITVGSWVAVAVGLLGFPLAWLTHRLRNRSTG